MADRDGSMPRSSGLNNGEAEIRELRFVAAAGLTMQHPPIHRSPY